jgi:nitrogen fixation protein NifX
MNALSREVALRIGLAARELPDTDPRRLIDVLLVCVGEPLDADKLTRLKVKDLKEAADGEFKDMPQAALKSALGCLRGEHTEAVEVDLPPVQAYQDGDMPASIRVACASNDATHLNGHFGSCARFLVYQVSKQEIRLIDIRSTRGDRDAEEKNEFRADLVNDCHVLYVMSIGGPAAAKVVKRDVYPIKLAQGGDIQEVVEDLRAVLNTSPPPWLAKVMGVAAEDRIRFTRPEAA